MSIEETELTINNPPNTDCFTGEFYQIFKEKMKPILYNFF